jgi:extradiol dioxygenase family protein
MLPVGDLEVAKKFYSDKLGLEQIGREGDEAVVYRTGESTLVVYRSEFAGTNKGTAALWEVDDVENTVRELKGRGVKFEHYDDLPHVTRKGDIHQAGDMTVAWFKDPAGNILSVQDSGR